MYKLYEIDDRYWAVYNGVHIINDDGIIVFLDDKTLKVRYPDGTIEDHYNYINGESNTWEIYKDPTQDITNVQECLDKLLDATNEYAHNPTNSALQFNFINLNNRYVELTKPKRITVIKNKCGDKQQLEDVLNTFSDIMLSQFLKTLMLTRARLTEAELRVSDIVIKSGETYFVHGESL